MQLDILEGTALISARPTLNYKLQLRALFEAALRTEPSSVPLIKPFCWRPFCWGINFFGIASFEVRFCMLTGLF